MLSGRVTRGVMAAAVWTAVVAEAGTGTTPDTTDTPASQTYTVAVSDAPAAAAGQPAPTGSESLQEAWRLAIERNKALAAANSDMEGAQAAERAARGARWPSLEANGSYTRLNASPAFDMATPGFTFRSGPIFRNDQYTSGTVQMKLPLYAGGQISAGIDAAHQALLGASQDRETALAALKLDVAEAYVGVLRARSALRAAESRQVHNRAAALRSASRTARNRAEDLRSVIELEVRQSWLDVQEAQARVKASREAVAQSDENLRMSRELYGAGLATNTQVLDAVTLHINAVNNRDNAVLDETLSRLRLAHAVGDL